MIVLFVAITKGDNIAEFDVSETRYGTVILDVYKARKTSCHANFKCSVSKLFFMHKTRHVA